MGRARTRKARRQEPTKGWALTKPWYTSLEQSC